MKKNFILSIKYLFNLKFNLQLGYQLFLLAIRLAFAFKLLFFIVMRGFMNDFKFHLH